ncbi:MAG: hypothetical protein PHE49_00590 [bacterium]|nr:hypothetical protein [bacterium]
MKIYEQGLEEHPKITIIFGNFMMLLWLALGTIACRFVHPLIGWIYLTFALLMVYVVLRKIVCTNCYYYGKWCPSGWGKLSALFFKKGDMEKFSTSVGIKLAPMTYGLLTVIPVILLIVSLFLKFSLPKIIVLVLLFLISFYSGGISRTKSCIRCKMRLMCPGCAVKTDTTK